MRTTLPTIATIFFFLSGCGGGGDGDGGEALPGKQTTYVIGGTVSGLAGTGLVLSNGNDRANVATNGAFRFSTELPSGSRYSIGVESHPLGQRCSIDTADGPVGTTPVNVTVTCNSSQFTIGGTITGLQGTSLELQNNGSDTRAVETTSPGFPGFSFGRALNTGDAFSVTISRQPSGPAQICEVSGGTGFVAASDVESVGIACVNALTISSTTPAHQASAVDRNANITVNFSANLNTATVNMGNVTLLSPGGNQVVALNPSGNQTVISPARHLLPLTTYTLNIDTTIRGLNSERMANAFTSSFTTRDAVWQSATLIENNDTAPAQPARAVMDESGNAMVLWTTQVPSGRTNLWSTRYNAASRTWGAPQRVEFNDTDGSYAGSLDIAADINGNIIAVWNQWIGASNTNDIWANHYSAATGTWGTPFLLETGSSAAISPSIGIDATGNATVIWLQTVNSRNHVWTNRYVPNVGWSGERPLESNPPGTNSSSPSIALNRNGEAIAVWTRYESGTSRYNLHGHRYTPNGGWTGAEITQPGTTYLSSASVAIDGSGNALVIWIQSDGIGDSAWVSRYTANGGWQGAATIENGGGRVTQPSIAMNDSGAAVAVWYQADAIGIDNHSIWSNRYTVNGGWSNAVAIESTANNAFYPRIAIDNAGNALAIWTQLDGSRGDLWTNRYAEGNWRTPVLLQNNSAGSAILINQKSGNAIAAWAQFDGTRNSVYADVFE
jgi:hypothetical protein